MDQGTKDLIMATLTLIMGSANWLIAKQGREALLQRIIELERQLADCLAQSAAAK